MASGRGSRHNPPMADIRIEPVEQPVEVHFEGQRVVRTNRALRLLEGSLPPRYYVPRDDVDMAHLERTSKQTHCPFKGTASYYSVQVRGAEAPNGAWTYEHPIPEVTAIREHLCFDDSKGIQIKVTES